MVLQAVEVVEHVVGASDGAQGETTSSSSRTVLACGIEDDVEEDALSEPDASGVMVPTSILTGGHDDEVRQEIR
jgi:hypothetical protein